MKRKLKTVLLTIDGQLINCSNIPKDVSKIINDNDKIIKKYLKSSLKIFIINLIHKYL